MFFSYHRKEACGRHAPKPENKSTKEEVELFDEAEPIQQKNENLRTKITLQERYNAALKDNIKETSTGNYGILRAVANDIFHLRVDLREAINKEKIAVNNALKTHHIFQLALKRYSPDDAIDWIDDKLFDNAKLLNDHLDRLLTKRKKLEASEVAVASLEKFPLPGSLPWEVEIDEKMKGVQVNQSNVVMKLECAKTLCGKYKTMRGRLQDERNMYQPILRNINNQLSFQHNELSNLEQMLGYAQKFSKDADEMLEMTEKEASFNRKMRRAQISRMRREMQRIVQEEQVALQGASRVQSEVRKGSPESQRQNGPLFKPDSSFLMLDDAEALLHERLTQKRAIIDTFNDTAAMLVDIMKIPNLTHIPKRMQDVISLTRIMKKERHSKEMLKRNLIKQRDQLMQLLCVIRYTGDGYVEQNKLILQDYQSALQDLEKKCARLEESISKDSNLMMDVQMGVNSLMVRIEGLEHKSINIRNQDHLMKMLPVFYEKLETLCKSLTQLKDELGPDAEVPPVTPQSRRQTQYRIAALTQQVPAKYVRVGEHLEVEDVSEEEEYDDFKVPGRLELKMRSEKHVEQALLRLGITDGGKTKKKSRQKSSFVPSSRHSSLS